MDPTILARIQFALTSAFHYLYPPMSIGLGVCLVLMEGLYLKTGDPFHKQLAKFWVRVFGLTFALGVATGIVLEFEFGTNWSDYSRFVGDIFGSALAAEGIFAFFLESGFLAILLFGWNKVGPRMHFFSTLMVCLGAHFSAVWILVANSWMQTPTGYHLVTEAGRTRAEIVDFWVMVFNPSSMSRLAHTLFGAWQTGAFMVISISAWYLLQGRHIRFARVSMNVGLTVGLIAAFGSLASGHRSAEVVAEHQPTKLAAMEGHWETDAPADLHLFGWVDEANQTTHGLKLPGMLSWLVHRDRTEPVPGLNAFPSEDLPPIQPVFQAFHAMVGIGMFLIAVNLAGAWFRRRGRLADTRWLLWIMVVSVVLPHAGNQLGWITAEVGRQPWVVYGLMRTVDGVSPSVSAGEILASLTMFGLIYLLLFVLFIFLLNHKIQHGPLDEDLEPEGHRA